MAEIQRLIEDLYIPFADINRAIPWPTNPEGRDENNAEHSFSLAVIAASLAPQVDLDPDRVASKALVHDLVERYAGDTSVWDEAAKATKAEREAEALEKLRSEYADNSWLITHLEEYESRATDEDRFVYALDKLLALMMVVEAKGYFWKGANVTFDDHLRIAGEKMKQVSEHPTVLEWYKTVMDFVKEHKSELFNSAKDTDDTIED